MFLSWCCISWHWWFQYILQCNPVKMPAMTMNNLNSNTSKIHTQYTSNTNLINLIHLIHPQYRHSTSKSCQYILNLQARCIRCILMYWMLMHRLNCKYIQNTRKYTVNTSTGLPPIFDFGENTKKRLIHGILSVFPMYMPFNTSSMYWKQAACIDTSNTA